MYPTQIYILIIILTIMEEGVNAESAFEQIIRINEALRPEVGSMSSRRREGISTTEANGNHIELFEGKILLIIVSSSFFLSLL